MLIDRNLADTTFLSGPEDTTITSDVYTKKDDSIVNALPALKIPGIDPTNLAAENKSIADDLRGGLMKSASLPALSDKLMAGATSLVGKLPASVTNAVSKALPGVVNKLGPSLISRVAGNSALASIPGLSGEVSKTLNNVLRDVPGGLSKILSQPVSNAAGSFVSMGGMTNRLAPDKIADAYSMSGLMNTVLGSNTVAKITDKDATSNFISALVTTSVNSGIPNSFSQLTQLAGLNKDVILSAAKGSITSIVKSGSMAALKDVMSSVPTGSFKSISDNVMGDIAKNFKLPASCNASDMKSQYDLATSTFKMVDSSWDKLQRTTTPNGNGEIVVEDSINLQTIQNGSPDFLKMMERGSLNSTDPNEKFYSLAGLFPSTSPEESLAAKYPMTATSVSSVTGGGNKVGSDVKIVTTSNSTGYDPSMGSELEYLKQNTQIDGVSTAMQTQAERDAAVARIKAYYASKQGDDDFARLNPGFGK